MKFFSKSDKSNVLELISWRKIIIIYIQSIIFNIFVLIKWTLSGVRSRVDQKFHIEEKLRLYRKFQFFSTKKEEQKFESYDKTPAFLINTNLGTHSFVKLKVSK